MLPRVRDGERSEVEAYRDIFAAAPPGIPAEALVAGGAIALRVAGAPLVELNRIVGLSSVAELEGLEPLYGDGRIVVSLDPEARLDDELLARGYREGYPWQKFERGVEPYEPHTTLSVRDAAGPGAFGPAVAAGFGAPPVFAQWLDALVGRLGWHVFVAHDGERAVGGGALFATGATGWLGIAGTLADARGRGAQSAIIAARIDRARELGLELLVTETGVPGDAGPGPSYRNILRAGFEPAYVRPNYARQ
jgi:GNAT superfamily N-acetyltransferase